MKLAHPFFQFFRMLVGCCFCCVVGGLACGQSSDETRGEALRDEFETPVRLQADGQIIDLGKLSPYAHAGPSWGDVDGDGDNDLLVGDFPGFFWLFENTGTNSEPKLTARGKLQAGGEDARTPVY